MSNQVYNFDDVSEYFDFILFGKKYRFKHLTSAEFQELQKLENEAKEDATKTDAFNDYVYSFITKVDEDAPDFKEVQKKMIFPQLKAFWNMIKTEFSAS